MQITRILHLNFEVVAVLFFWIHALLFFSALNIIWQTLQRHELYASAAPNQPEMRPASPAEL
jgi:hypothetical protein